MKRLFFLFVSTGIIFIILLIALLSLKAITPLSQPSVAATIFPIYDITRTIAEPETPVVLILEPGASPHTFELTPSQATKLAAVDTIFMIGQGIDYWINDINEVTDASTISLDKDIDLKCEDEFEDLHDDIGIDHVSCDPHYWLNAQNAATMAETIRDTLIDRDPKNSELYEARTDMYLSELGLLDKSISVSLNEIPNKSIIAFHDSWNYFADAYGISIRGTFEPSPGQEPTPRQIAELQELVSVYNIKTIYREPQLPEASVRAFATDLAIDIAMLDPIGGTDDRQSYIDMMRYNAKILAETLTQ
jgi:zinc transport system substrate-binding protein